MADIATLGLKVDSRGVVSATKNLDKLEGQGRRTESTIKKLGTAFAALGAAAAIKSAISLTADFNQAIADLSAITGAAGKDLEFYRLQAEEIGRTTSLSASQAAAAFKLIASAKPDLLGSAEALNAVTRAAVTLAEATGQDLPTAASALGGALNQFQLDASKANEVINIFAASSKLGTVEVDLVTEALKNAGPAANSLGISLVETVAGIQALAKATIKGAEGGTALRQIMLKLEKTGDEKLQPSLVGIVGAINELEKRGLSNVEMMKLFGDEAFSAAVAIIAQKDTLEELNITMRGTNTATEQASIRMDTLTGDFLKLKSAIEGLAIGVFSDEADGLLRSLTQLSTEGVNALTENLDTLADVGTVVALVIGSRLVGATATLTAATVKNTVATLTAVPASAGLSAALGVQASRATAATVAMNATAIAARGAAGAMALLGGPIGLVALLAGSLYLYSQRADEATQETEDFTASLLKLRGETAALTVLNIEKAIESYNEKLKEAQDHHQVLLKRTNAYDSAVSENFKKIRSIKDIIAEYNVKLDEAKNKLNGVKEATDDVTMASGNAEKAFRSFIESFDIDSDALSALDDELEAFAQKAREQEALKLALTVDIESLRQSLLTVEETESEFHDRRLAQIFEFSQRGLDEQIKAQELFQRENERHQEKMVEIAEEGAEKSTDKMTEFTIQAARNMESAMADGFFDIMQGEFGNLEQSFKRMIDRMVAELLASQLLDFLKETAVGGGFGEFIGGIASNVFGPVPAAANGMNFAPGGTTLVGERGPELVNLPRGAQVIPNNKLGMQGNQIVVNVNVSGVRDEGSLNRSATQIAQQVGSAAQRAIARNG